MFRKQAFYILIPAVFFSASLQAELIDGEEFVDPTRPLAELTIEDDGLDLDMIFRNVVPENYDLSFTRASTSNPMAVINNQRVTIGDLIGGATVAKITRSSVTLLVGDEERVIGLYDTSVKSAVKNQ